MIIVKNNVQYTHTKCGGNLERIAKVDSFLDWWRCERCKDSWQEYSPDPQPSALHPLIEQLPEFSEVSDWNEMEVLWDKIQEIIKELNRRNRV